MGNRTGKTNPQPDVKHAMLETEDFESDMSFVAHMCSEDDMSSDDVSVDVALVQKKPKKKPKKRYKSFQITSADQVVGWWSKTGKEESDTSRDSKQCYAIHFREDRSVFYRNPTFSCRGTFYNGNWDLQDSGKLHIVFRGYNNLKVQSRSEIEPDVEVVMHDGESCIVISVRGDTSPPIPKLERGAGIKPAKKD